MSEKKKIGKVNTDRYKFFQNRECEYFPCHDSVNEEEFNCLFCYCPLYFTENCGGGCRYNEKGIKICTDCPVPHKKENYEMITMKAKTEMKRRGRERVGKKYAGVIFDMDGTILDTSVDLTNTMNYALEQCGLPAGFDPSVGKLFYGSAVHVACRRAIACGKGATPEEMHRIGSEGDVETPEEKELADRVQKAFIPHYAEHSADFTKPYDGITEMMELLRKQGIRLAVASNKYHSAATALADTYFPGLMDISIGESETVPKKPDPAMVRKIISEWGLKDDQIVYIGDSDVDLETAENSGVDCISVDWGFTTRDFLIEHGAERIAHTAEELTEMILDTEA